MDDYLMVLLRTIEVIALLYGLLIILYTIGWYLLKKDVSIPPSQGTRVSVLIAARNESLQINHILHGLLGQDYPSSLLEIILVDDHSEDSTAEIISAFIKDNPSINITLIHAKKQGKKAALSEALARASGQFVLVTDADCSIRKTWVSTMVAIYRHQQVKLLLGPVMIEPGTQFFGRLQSLEFMSLIGSTAGASGIGFPEMANGANLGFDRLAVAELGEEALNDRHASGDDIFLLFAMLKKFGKKSVSFAFHENAVVKTGALPNVMAFLRQRLRWVSKSSGYTNIGIVLPAIIVFVFNLTFLVLLGMAFFYPYLILIYLLLILFKFMIDYPLLSGVCSFMKSRKLLIWALPLEIIYPFYVVFVAVAGNIAGVSWKGRKVK